MQILLEIPSHSIGSFLDKSIHCVVSTSALLSNIPHWFGNILFGHITLLPPPYPAADCNKGTKCTEGGNVLIKK
jgi:hypothetical protein